MGKKEIQEIQIHGVVVSIEGVGVLLVGESGLGKSETALELVSKGHELVADDAVIVANEAGKLSGRAPELIAGILEIGGLGVVDIREVFGPNSIRRSAEIELCVQLKGAEAVTGADRFVTEPGFERLLGIDIPKIVIPVRRGRNIPVLIETAVKLLKLGRPVGYFDADGVTFRSSGEN